MGKKTADPSLKGKRPSNTTKPKHRSNNAAVGGGGGGGQAVVVVPRNPGRIANKLKRSEMYGKYLQQKRVAKKRARLQREKDVAVLGEDDGSGEGGAAASAVAAARKNTPKTIDNTRELEPTMVLPDDVEVAADEADDEFAPYFGGEEKPKVLVTTRPHPSSQLFYFIADLQKLIPALHFYPRKSFSVKDICQFAANRDFTHLMILSEKSKVCNGLTISHLRKHDNGLVEGGPTAFFKVTNVVTSKDIPNHGASTSHIPELNLHGFGTRLGHRVGRLLGSLFPHDAQFQGRQVVTFHNQRDYIFVRHHRYVFKEDSSNAKTAAARQNQAGGGSGNAAADDNGQSPARIPGIRTRLQELGPRFSLKLRWLQEGTFDTQLGEYEWIHKRKEMDTTRRKFHL